MKKKTCSRCKKKLPVQVFGHLAAAADRRNYSCKSCVSLKNRDSYKGLTFKSNEHKRRFYKQKYQRRKNSPAELIRERMRTRIYYLLKEIPGKSRPRTSEVIGCTGRELKKHLEDQFTPEMCWENYGTYWHVDHIIPLASAGEDVERLVMLCHYTNLQPLSAKENLRKGSKLIVP